MLVFVCFLKKDNEAYKIEQQIFVTWLEKINQWVKQSCFKIIAYPEDLKIEKHLNI